eukprot:Anaeramoba_ignava/a609194_26.p1 GENE.a609194_26~~a609194_26.p1  ORF type:complete len:395 (-),score=8.73 a609194_26:1812-2996(-)
MYILMALDSQRQYDHESSLRYFKKLYELTNDKQYLLNSIKYTFLLKDFSQMAQLSQIGLDKYKSKEDQDYFMVQYIVALTNEKNYDKALLIADKLIDNEQSAQNYGIMAGIYYAKEDYKNALKYYESAYAHEQNEQTLLRLVNILYSYLNEKDTALAYLETFLQTHGCKRKVCDKLMLIYQEQGNINGMLSILNKLYTKYSNEPGTENTIAMIQNLIVSLLEKRSNNEAILYLETYDLDPTKLLSLYYKEGYYKKAITLTKKLYNKTKDPELLGKIAMYRFEDAEDKRKVLDTVIANFELALSSGINNDSFQNYYGYILIDFDIDIEKGISLVKQALKTSPNNIAYQDSLAWGYYKLGKCDEAFEIMSMIVKTIGLKDDEIRLHWEKINECKNK